jgi:CRP-like cAMP-binding protein
MFTHDQDENDFLAGLSSAEFAIFRSHLIPVDLHVGDRLHCRGEPVDRVIFPRTGLVMMTMPVGEDHWGGVGLIGRDGVVGGVAAAASALASCDAEVQIAGVGWRMSAPAFRDILDGHPSIRKHAARFHSAMMAQAQQTALCHAAHSVEARVCRWLLEVQDRIGGSSVPLTQATLAQLLSVRRTTVTLVVGRLEAAGVVKCRRGYFHILSQQELERRACECHGHVKAYVAELFARPHVIIPPHESADSQAVC